MNKDELIFNSRRCPGSVVVYKNGHGIGVITKMGVDTEMAKKDDRIFIPIKKDVDIKAVKPGTYESVKEQVVKLFS